MYYIEIEEALIKSRKAVMASNNSAGESVLSFCLPHIRHRIAEIPEELVPSARVLGITITKRIPEKCLA